MFFKHERGNWCQFRGLMTDKFSPPFPPFCLGKFSFFVLSSAGWKDTTFFYLSSMDLLISRKWFVRSEHAFYDIPRNFDKSPDSISQLEHIGARKMEKWILPGIVLSTFHEILRLSRVNTLSERAEAKIEPRFSLHFQAHLSRSMKCEGAKTKCLHPDLS